MTPASTLRPAHAPESRLRIHLCLALLAMASTCASAQPGAQDLTALPLEQLLDMDVRTASRFDQKASRAPSAVRVITADDIRRHGWRTLAQALESLPGLHVSDDRGYSYLGARGILRPGDYDTRFLVLVDGHRLNDPVYSQGVVGSDFPLDMALIERIEYVPGPGSALYGSNAFFGVVNVMTRDAASFGHGELETGVGSQNTRALRSSVVTRGALGETVLSASVSRSDGDDLALPVYADAASDGIARGLDATRTRRIFVHHRSGDLGLLLVAGRRRKEIPTANYGQVFGIPGADIDDRWAMLGVDYRQALTPSTDWFVQGRLLDFRYVGNYVYPELNRDEARGRSFALESGIVTRALSGHVIAAGVEVNLKRGVDQSNIDVASREVLFQSRDAGERAGIYINDEWTWNLQWALSTGLRLDSEAGDSVRLSPRVALVGALRPGTTLKAIAGHAFRSPNSYEREYEVEGPGGQRANPDLGAEHIYTTELLLTQELGTTTQVDLGIYRYRLRSLITLVEDSDGMLTLENAASARSRGVEASLLRRWAGGMQVRASYAYADVEGWNEHGQPINSPRHLGKLYVTAPLGESVSLALGSRYTSSRATRDGRVGGVTVVDTNLLWAVPGTRVDVSLGVDNLFDRTYADPAGPEFLPEAVPRRGRTAMLDVLWRF
ncbi:TonB-dependent receptor plug domain-containing protein [Luteimonas terrae]|uniref:Iron complex outermembrane receptor protein n=1 Tax=Luteimonas terrae TaxID=1530191 RepID=A0ABU1XV04_9GAMM|nr:TonB-dependent receptor [Luteimonas terrae]MDR7191906.1 iron complex outermembrane receptor protein [Luteimonas terrae]